MSFYITLILFALTYAGLALGKVPGLRMDRAGIALVGAALMLVTGMLTFADRPSAPSPSTTRRSLLLFGMMIVVGVPAAVGLLRAAGRARHCGASARPMACWRRPSACPACCRRS